MNVLKLLHDTPHFTVYSLGVVFLSVILGLVVAWRDWEYFEADDREALGLVVLAFLWSWLGVHHIVSSIIAAVLVTAPGVIAWLFTRKNRHPLVADGDFLLFCAAGLWCGLSGILFFMIFFAAFGFVMLLLGSPRVYYARQRESRGESPDWKGRFRPTRYMAYPAAPAIIASVVTWVLLSYHYS